MSRFLHLNLAWKIGIGCGLLFLLVLAAGGGAIPKLSQMSSQISYILGKRIPVADMTMEVQIQVLKARDAMAEFLAHEEGFEEIKEEFRTYLTQARKSLNSNLCLKANEKKYERKYS